MNEFFKQLKLWFIGILVGAFISWPVFFVNVFAGIILFVFIAIIAKGIVKMLFEKLD